MIRIVLYVLALSLAACEDRSIYCGTVSKAEMIKDTWCCFRERVEFEDGSKSQIVEEARVGDNICLFGNGVWKYNYNVYK